MLDLDAISWGTRLSPTPSPPAPTPPGGPLLRQLQECVGTFHHPAYGDFSFDVRDGELAASFHGLKDELLLTHLSGDDWQLSFPAVPGISVPVSFRPGPDGQIADVTLRLDAELAPLVFPRR